MWSRILVSFDRVQRLAASLCGDSSRPSRPRLGYPQRVLGAGLVFEHSMGIPDSGTRDRLSNPFCGPVYDLSSFLSCQVRTLSYRGRKDRGGSPFRSLGAPFQVGAVAAL